MPRILVVARNDELQAAVMVGLRNGEHEVRTAGSAGEVLRCLETDTPDILILGPPVSEEEGLEILKTVRKEHRYDLLPIVFLSDRDDVPAVVQGLDLGAIEYLVPPVDPQELGARIRAFLRLKRVQDKLVADYERASELSLTDPLTGVYNRRALNRMLKVRLAESTRSNIPVSCVMLDIDHFKRVNDTHGHTTGDRVLREVSSLTLSLFREEDALIRYGGEEFLVILFHCPRRGAFTFAERLRASVAAHTFDRDHEPLRITLSAGIATYPEDSDIEGVEGMITVADRRLYEAKRTGRNRVVFEP